MDVLSLIELAYRLDVPDDRWLAELADSHEAPGVDSSHERTLLVHRRTSGVCDRH